MAPQSGSHRPRPDQRLARRGGHVEALWPLAWAFGGVARLRAALYERGWLPSARLEAPVISVGNLSAGGTGKTPMVAWVAGRLAAMGLRPGVAARGYGSRAGTLSDEGRMQAEELPGVAREEDADRIEAGRRLLARGCDVVVLDDGFQHRRLARDLDLVLVDALRPWGLAAPPGGGPAVRACLPRGLLREPPGAVARADALIVTRSDQVPSAELDALIEELGRLAPGRPVALARHRPRALLDGAGREAAPESLRGAEVDLVSGIGNPEAFELLVRALGAKVCGQLVFPDHHEYVAADVEGMATPGRMLLTTSKDAVKLRALAVPVHTLAVELELVSGEAVLAALFESLPQARSRLFQQSLHEGLHG